MVNAETLEKYITGSRSRFEEMLGQMVEVPSISMDPARAGDMRRMAELAVQYLTDLGAEAQIVETGGYPIVSGGWTTGAHHPTVTIYNHMDVQPAQEPEWRQAPFAFKNENGLYRGRGATDDKGPALSALLGARFALDEGTPINIRLLWELEEEIGSPHFAAGLKNRAAIPRPDSVVVSDTIWIAKGRPAMPYGLRGLIGAQADAQDRHEGRAFRCHWRGRTKSISRAHGDRSCLRRCENRQGEDSRFLRRCRGADKGRDQEFSQVRL